MNPSSGSGAQSATLCHSHLRGSKARYDRYLSSVRGDGGRLVRLGSALWSGTNRAITARLSRVGIVAVLTAALATSWSEGRAGSAPSARANAMSEYRLGPLDKIRIRVFEWRPSRDEIVAWAALNAEYSVGPAGTIALPLIGELKAGGVDTSGLAREIAVRLRDRMGLAEAPDTVVEIVEFRPIYVTGHVEKPGEYAFRPGLSVLQALSLSGGLLRLNNGGAMRLDREIVSTVGELQLLQYERHTLLARRARLRSEFQRTSDIAFPEDVVGPAAPAAARQIADQERLVFDSRSNSRATQMSALRQLKDHLRQEVAFLTEQIAAHKRQLALMRIELDQIAALASKGLATAPRKLALERNAAQLEGEGLRLEVNLQRARQEVSKTEIAMIELENKRSDELTGELLQSQIRLDQVEARLATAGALLHEAQVLAPVQQALFRRGTMAAARFTIVRLQGDQSIEIDAAETTQVLPGDTVKVHMEIRSDPTPEVMPAKSKPAPAAPAEPRTRDLGASRASLGAVEQGLGELVPR